MSHLAGVQDFALMTENGSCENFVPWDMSLGTSQWRMGQQLHAPLESLLASLTVILIITYPTASQSPEGQYPKEKICDVKSCCCSCLPSLRSHDLTVLSKPPVSKQSISDMMFNQMIS